MAVKEIEALANSQTDWLPKAFAEAALARRMYDDGRIGDALRLLARTVQSIPKEQATEASVAAAVWDVAAIGHVMVDDIPGHLRAIEIAETYMAASNYPRPDYESVYNLAQSLSYLGRHDEASQLVAIYSRLATRTNTPTSLAYAGNICAFASSSRDDWNAVLKCLAPFGPNLSMPDVVRNAALAFRATAYARTGNATLAQQDVDEMRFLIKAQKMVMGSGVQRSEAELLLAKGDFQRGVPALRTYHLERFQRVSRSAAAAMEQVVNNIDAQLKAATEQNQLKNEIINAHRLMFAILIFLGLVMAGFAIILAKQRKLYRLQSITDPLTGLANRRHTEQRVSEIIQLAVERDGQAVVAILDLDHFKSCNDRFGHDAGDDALKTFANLVNKNIRPGDIFGRWGGEEFLLALSNAGLEEARILLQRVADAAALTKVTLAPEYPLRFSAGAVEVPSSGRSLEDVLLVADKLLYAAKKAGRNRVHYAGLNQSGQENATATRPD